MELYRLDISRLGIALVPVLLTACVTIGGQPPTVSSERTGEFVSKFEENTDAGLQKFKEMQNHITANFESTRVAWLQPLNKTISCKVFVAEPREKEVPWWISGEAKIYWDGACKDGYAFGVGREFLDSKKGLSSWLGEYFGAEQKPSYYLVVNYDTQDISFQVSNLHTAVRLEYKVQQSAIAKRISTEYRFADFPEKRLYGMGRYIGEDIVQMGVTLSNNNSYMIETNHNPAQGVWFMFTRNGQNERIGYSVLNINNLIKKQVRHFEQINQVQSKDVTLPLTYLNHLAALEKVISTKLNIADNMLQQSFSAINKYKRMICVGKVSVPFVDDEIYGRICLKNGELSPYDDLVTTLLSDQKKRHEQASQQVAQQQVLNAQQQSTREGQARQNSNAMQNDMNNFARDMNQLNQNAAQTAQAYIGALHPQGSVQFGVQPNVQTNCVRISNFVNCRSQ